ncbi:O-antigen ligase family protein [Sphingomonas sp. Leaf4]|uniref:O-antigen ligase family protein n=1 Tax=Sphingomonas sp. Leaf4 TaxID=2876553 RepID=UPI001E30F8EC|nr:O-antigen ligase family protein [Sphingomonas sp. Leaf4]
MGDIGRNGFLLATAVALLWPRYFFVNVAGKGVSGYTAITLPMLVGAIVALLGSGATRAIVARGMAHTLPMLLAIVAWSAWRILTDLTGLTPAASLMETMQDLVFTTGWLWIGMVFLADPVAMARLPAVLLIAGIAATGFGLIEYASGQPLLAALGLNRIAAGDANQLRAIASASSDAASGFRIKASFAHPIVYGQAMAVLAPLSLHCLLSRGIARRLGGTLLAVAIVVALVLCGSRSPLIVFGVALIVYGVLRQFDVRRPARLLVLNVAGVGALIALPVVVDATQNLVTGTDAREIGSTQVRALQFQRARTALDQRALAGYGGGQAKYHAGVVGRNDVLTVDSQYLVLAVDHGLVGLALYALMTLAIVLTGARLAIGARDPGRRSILGFWTALVCGNAAGLSIVAIDDMLTFTYLAAGVFVAHAGRPPHAPG